MTANSETPDAGFMMTAKSRHRLKRVSALATLGLTLVGVVWRIYVWFNPSPVNQQDIMAFMTDPTGKPRILPVVGEDGGILYPDERGLLKFPTRWNGKMISVRDPKDWREVSTLSVPEKRRGIVRIVVP